MGKAHKEAENDPQISRIFRIQKRISPNPSGNPFHLRNLWTISVLPSWIIFSLDSP
jgi:hypothetical protein